MSTSEELLAERTRQVPRGPFNVHPIFVREAKGAVLTDLEGKRYIDFAGGIGAVNLGHGPDEVLQAVRDQLERYIHTCFHVVMYEPYVRLAGRLNEITPGRFPKKTLLVNSGAEAVENAVKVARHATGRPGVIAFENGFHGRTYLAMSLTSKTMPYKAGFGPYVPEVYRMPYAYCYRCVFHLEYPSCDLACAYHLKTFFQSHVPADQVACLVVEPVLGEGGFVVPPMEYLSVLRQICAKEGIVFIADEVQTGFGRTGELFACEAFAVEPDLMILGKSLAAGFPLSAVTGKAELMDHPQVGGLGGTYGGNPVACAAALKVLDLFEKMDVRRRARAIGARVLEKFREIQDRCSLVGDVRGLGAMVGMEFVTDRKTKEPASALVRNLVARCREKGLLLISAGLYSNVVRSLMPLVITDDELETGLAILEESVLELVSDVTHIRRRLWPHGSPHSHKRGSAKGV